MSSLLRGLGTLAAVLTLAAATSGCTPSVWAVSKAPPARLGELWKKNNSGEDRIRVSKGVAFAIECDDVWLGGPCKDATAHMADPKVARVLPGHLEKIKNPWAGPQSYYDEDVSHRAVFVIAGVEAGDTVLTINSSDGDRQFVVEVEP